MSRKAQALPMNTVIIAILVVLVLFVVAAFFLGGTGGIMKQIRSLFYGTTAGTAEVLAVQTCEQRCEQLKLLPRTSIPSSAYCTQHFFIDKDNDGEADFVDPQDTKQGYKKYFCFGETTQARQSLNVPCRLDDGTVADTLCRGGQPLSGGLQGPTK